MSFTRGYAVVVGVGADLPVTLKDATAISDLLVDSARAGYAREHVTLLKESTANRKGILDSLDELVAKVNVDPEGMAIVYFSGHGVRVPNGAAADYFLVPWGYDGSDRKSTAISSQELTDRIQQIQQARKALIILDCCHAAGMPALKGESATATVAPPDELIRSLGEGSGFVVVTACSEGETALAGEPYSVFTTCLLEAMQRGGSPPDGYSRILDVIKYLLAEVPARALQRRAGHRQHPVVNKILHLTDNFPLCATTQASFTKTPVLTRGQQQGLRIRLDGVQAELTPLGKRVIALRDALGFETDVARRLKLEHDIQKDDQRIDELSKEIERIEKQLDP